MGTSFFGTCLPKQMFSHSGNCWVIRLIGKIYKMRGIEKTSFASYMGIYEPRPKKFSLQSADRLCRKTRSAGVARKYPWQGQFAENLSFFEKKLLALAGEMGNAWAFENGNDLNWRDDPLERHIATTERLHHEKDNPSGPDGSCPGGTVASSKPAPGSTSSSASDSTGTGRAAATIRFGVCFATASLREGLPPSIRASALMTGCFNTGGGSGCGNSGGCGNNYGGYGGYGTGMNQPGPLPPATLLHPT